MNEEQKRKMADALEGLSIADIIKSDRFRENLAAYLTAQREDRKKIRASYAAMRKLGGTKGYKLPSHVIDRFMDISVEDFAGLYAGMLDHSIWRPYAERKYIMQLGQQAYNLTIVQIAAEKYPELESLLNPKK